MTSFFSLPGCLCTVSFGFFVRREDFQVAFSFFDQKRWSITATFICRSFLLCALCVLCGL